MSIFCLKIKVVKSLEGYMTKEPVVLKRIDIQEEPPEKICHESGTSLEKAIVLTANQPPGTNKMLIHLTAIQKEYQIVHRMICACGKLGHAQIMMQMMIEKQGKKYDVLKLRCPEKGNTWTIYFDITDVLKHVPQEEQ